MDHNELKALISLLDDDDKEVIGHVHSKLFSMGHQIVPMLEDFWQQTPSERLQGRLEEIIQGIQHKSVSERLTKWVRNEQDDLLKGMWTIASFTYPGLQFSQLKQEVEQLYYEVWLEFKYDMHPFDQIKVLNGIFFGKLGFKADLKNFHAVENSMINRVIGKRKGNPISLCVVYMLIAQKLKLPVYGVNLPNLFILTYKNEQLQFYVNAFNKGLIFSKTDIDSYVGQLNMERKREYYEPCSNLDIVRRVLRNLKNAYERSDKPTKAAGVVGLLNILEQQ